MALATITAHSTIPLNVPAGRRARCVCGLAARQQRRKLRVAFQFDGRRHVEPVVNYVRDNLDGDWSAFAGTINVSPKPSGSGDEMRINNAFGYANAAIFLNDNVVMNRVTTSNSIVDIGELGAPPAIVGPEIKVPVMSLGVSVRRILPRPLLGLSPTITSPP